MTIANDLPTEFFIYAERIMEPSYLLFYILQFWFHCEIDLFPKLYISFTCSNTILWSLMSIFYVPACSCSYIRSDISKNVTSSFPHYGHSGIVEAARELFMQIEGNPEELGKKCSGFFKLLVLWESWFCQIYFSSSFPLN